MRFLLLFIAAWAAAGTETGELAWIEERGGEIIRDQRARVTGIRLGLAWVTDGDIARLASLGDLKSLDLSFTLLTDAGLEVLSPLRNVEKLNLSSAELITDTAIAQVRGWKQLRVLNLRGTDVTDTSMEYISSLPALESLDVSYTQITNNGMEYLGPLTKLEELSLGGNKITGAGLHILKSLPRLKHLNLSGAQKRNSGTWATALTESDMATIAGLKGLETLSLGGLRITAAGVARLATLTNLRSLDLSRTQLPNESLSVLASMPLLERLNLWKAQGIGDAAVPHLTVLRKLTLLDVAETKLTDVAVDSIRKAMPACRILWK